MNDDLNVPLALGTLWKAVKLPKSRDIYSLALEMDQVMGLDLDKLPQPVKKEIPPEVVAVAEERKIARAQKNWTESDRLREKIREMGYSVKDLPDGYELTEL